MDKRSREPKAMAIPESQLLSVLDALGDAVDGLRRGHQLVKDSAHRVRDGANAQAEIEALEVMLDPRVLMENAIETISTLERERAHWTPARRRANAKRRQRRAPQAEDFPTTATFPTQGDSE